MHPDAGAQWRPLAHAPPGGLLAGLTREQAQAVQHSGGPLLLIAGPGAGKTRTLTHRVAHLLATGRARPSEILAVTFSVRAAGELRLRLADLLGEEQARGVTAATFHSICARMLRQHAALFGRTEAYTIYDQADVRRVIEWLLSDAQRGAVQAALRSCGQPASREVLAEISRAKNRLLGPEHYEQAARHPAGALVAAVWRELEAELRRSNSFDFDDLIACGVRLLAEHPHRLAFYRQRWPQIVVDEYQDTNEAQGMLVALLAGPAGQVCCVGDVDQLVYGFRCAEPRNMLAFGERFPGHRTIVLGRNFRSRAEILEPAVACVSHNRARIAKALIAMRGPGGQVTVTGLASERHEAEWVAGLVADALARGTPPDEILIVARTGYALGPVQHALARAGIPHRVLGSLGLYERAEVRDALAHLALLANPADAQALRRAIGAPKRGVGTATANRIVTHARERHGGDFLHACARARDLHGIPRPVRERIAEFGQALDRVRAELAAGRSLGHAAVATVMLPGGLVDHHQRRRDHAPGAVERRDAERVLEDLRSLCRAAQTFEHEHPDNATAAAFLEHAAGLHAHQLAPGEPDRRITASTIHRAKGTEAALVVLMGCEDRLLPSWRALAHPDPGRLEEERRLFYVAATRAKDRLAITHAATRNQRSTGGPSRFLHEAGLTGAEQPLAA